MNIGPHSRVRFAIDPFTGELGSQVYCSYGRKLKQYDMWMWTAGLNYLQKNSCCRPLVLTIAGVPK